MARSFNGSTDLINFGNAAGLDPQLGMTVGAWINSSTVASGEACIVSRGRAGANGFNFQRVNGDELRISKHGVVDIDSTAINLTASTWLFVAAVVSSTQVRFHKYVPGSGLTSQNIANNQNFNAGATESYVGGLLNGAGSAVNFWTGGLAEVAKWNRELSDDEITALGKALSTGFVPNSLRYYAPLIGRISPEIDLRLGASGTLTGTTQLDHPRITYPDTFNTFTFTQIVASTTSPTRMMLGMGM